MHPIEQALMADIRAEPERDDLRLILADWLEENDEPLRAEFIRLQIKLEPFRKQCRCRNCQSLFPPRPKPKTEYKTANCRVCNTPEALREREIWHYKKSDDTWTIPDPPRGDPLNPLEVLLPSDVTNRTNALVFQRGFVQWVSCTSKEWFSIADALTAEHPVQYVTLITLPNIVHSEKFGHWYFPDYPGSERLVLLPGSEPRGLYRHVRELLKLLWPKILWPKIQFTLPQENV